MDEARKMVIENSVNTVFSRIYKSDGIVPISDAILFIIFDQVNAVRRAVGMDAISKKEILELLVNKVIEMENSGNFGK